MVDSLIPQSVRIKQHMEHPPRLIDDYEIAAAVGLACRDIGEALPMEDDLAAVQKIFRVREDIDPVLKYLIGSREVDHRREDWRRLMECGYQYSLDR